MNVDAPYFVEINSIYGGATVAGFRFEIDVGPETVTVKVKQNIWNEEDYHWTARITIASTASGSIVWDQKLHEFSGYTEEWTEAWPYYPTTWMLTSWNAHLLDTSQNPERSYYGGGSRFFYTRPRDWRIISKYEHLTMLDEIQQLPDVRNFMRATNMKWTTPVTYELIRKILLAHPEYLKDGDQIDPEPVMDKEMYERARHTTMPSYMLRYIGMDDNDMSDSEEEEDHGEEEDHPPREPFDDGLPYPPDMDIT